MKLLISKNLARSFIAVCLILTLIAASNAQAADYCSSSGRNVSYEWIDSIAVGIFSNASGANGGYADFTGMIADLAVGVNAITLTPGFRYGSYNEYWRIWVDLNQNQVFDPDELLFDQSSRSQITGEITVPKDAVPGTTRMRISMKWSGAPPACGTFYYGEVEDYTVQIGQPEVVLGKIGDMVATNDPEFVYAIDEDNQALHLISTSNQKIVNTLSLPDAQPVAMDYSPEDDKLYIVSAQSGQITVYDLVTSQLSQLPFSDSQNGSDIDVAPLLRQIFVLSPNGYDSYLTVLDMDSGTVILEDAVGGSSIAVDEHNQMIFTGNRGLSPSTIRKYSVGSNSVQLVQTVPAGGNGREIGISPDGLHIVYPCGGGNGAGYTIYDYDSTDLDNVFGEWNVGTYPKGAAFSPDGTVFFGTNGSAYDNYLYVMEAATYQQIRKLEFLNADDYAVFTPNSDGSVVVGFSYDTYYDDDYSLYFFTDVKPDPSTPVELGKISDMAAANDPQFVYAIDQDHEALHIISTSGQEIVESVLLPDTQPVAMDYSPVDNKLYIVSAFSGQIMVYDLNSSQISVLPFSATKDGRDIVVAPALRRIYVLSPNGYDSYLTILDMDSGAVVLEDTVGGSSIALDEANDMIFTGNSGLSPSTILKYSISNDNLQLVQSIQAGSNGRKINISSDGLHVVLPCGGGNGPGYTIYDYDSLDLTRVLGEWDVGTYPKYAAFSPDNTILYGTNGSTYDNYLYVMDAATHQQIRKLDFPNADDYVVFTPNSDGTVVVGFSYNTYYDEGHSLYFFTDVVN